MERLDPMDAMQEVSPVIGIDLGTTNSVVAVCVDGRVRVLEEEGTALVPSVVGIGMDGRLLVGQSARNQLAAFPDRTIASAKRRMGQAVCCPWPARPTRRRRSAASSCGRSRTGPSGPSADR